LHAVDRMNEAVVATVADIAGATGLRIIRANPTGERDPEVMARLRDYRGRANGRRSRRRSPGAVCAGAGTRQDRHRFEATQHRSWLQIGFGAVSTPAENRSSERTGLRCEAASTIASSKPRAKGEMNGRGCSRNHRQEAALLSCVFQGETMQQREKSDDR
jgi:hypothetical protein